MPFELATASRVIFGPGSARSLGAIAAEFGRRIIPGSVPPGVEEKLKERFEF